MGVRNPFDNLMGAWVNNPTLIVDKLIGSAFHVVEFVACNMQFIRYVAHYMPSIVAVANEGRQSKLVRSVGPAKGQTLTVALPMVNQSIYTFTASLRTSDDEVVPPNEAFHVRVTAAGIVVSIDADAPDSYAAGVVSVVLHYDSNYGQAQA